MARSAVVDIFAGLGGLAEGFSRVRPKGGDAGYQIALSMPLAEFIELVSAPTHDHVTNPPGGQNITEWCKKEKCWESFRELDVEVPSAVDAGLITRDARARSGEHTLDEQASAAEARIIAEVAAVPAETWFNLAAWAKNTQSLQPWQRSLSFSLGRLAGAGRPPSRKQATHGDKMLKEARSLGFRG